MPVKVKLSSPFLGNNCYVGSNVKPVEITLTTGQSGVLHGLSGHFEGEEEGGILEISDNSLVNNTYASPGRRLRQGKTEPTKRVNSKIGLPAAKG